MNRDRESMLKRRSPPPRESRETGRPVKRAGLFPWCPGEGKGDGFRVLGGEPGCPPYVGFVTRFHVMDIVLFFHH